MRMSIYLRLAVDGIRKNRRLYIPYLLTGMVMVMMSYIIFFLSHTELLEHMKGGGILRTLLPVGSVVVAVFSLLFLFYSCSFLIRQRYKEFGLYNILGMDKHNLGRIMLWENLIAAVISIGGGLIAGIALSKLSELCMCNLLLEDVDYAFRLDIASAVKTALIFAGIFYLLLLNALIKVRRSNPLSLLLSSNVGEKPPKANWLLAILGVVILAAAYYIALSIEQPLTAIVWFMIAVVMVIVATYLLFIAGSVALCRFLQKRKSYYYQARHFVSVSSMVYRMKRNGAGLASICVLITIVLVMLSSTLSMYIGAEDSLLSRYPKDITLRLSIPDMAHFNEESFSRMRTGLDELAPAKEDVVEYAGVDIVGFFTSEGIIVDQKFLTDFDLSTYEHVGYLHIISLEDYNRIMGTKETLAADECLLHCFRTEYAGDTFTIQNCKTLQVKTQLTEAYISGYSAMQMVPTITLVTTDIPALLAPVSHLTNSLGYSILEAFWSCDFNVAGDANAKIKVYDDIRAGINSILIPNADGSASYSHGSREAERSTFYGLYAGLFFIGILLSIVFLFAAVLIIYYKQISEGYEDQKRFEVMQKVGMTKQDIRRSINSQVLTVFFLPLLLAGLHLAFAFPILWKLLQMFNFDNVHLMIMVTICCFAVFALAYAIVYKITSNAYYAIVSSNKE